MSESQRLFLKSQIDHWLLWKGFSSYSSQIKSFPEDQISFEQLVNLGVPKELILSFCESVDRLKSKDPSTISSIESFKSVRSAPEVERKTTIPNHQRLLRSRSLIAQSLPSSVRHRPVDESVQILQPRIIQTEEVQRSPTCLRRLRITTPSASLNSRLIPKISKQPPESEVFEEQRPVRVDSTGRILISYIFKKRHAMNETGETLPDAREDLYIEQHTNSQPIYRLSMTQ